MEENNQPKIEWNELSNASKEAVQTIYKNLKDATGHGDIGKLWLLDELFGEENLEPKISTWKQALEAWKKDNKFNNSQLNMLQCQSWMETNKLVKLKANAIFKLGKLIEVGYGGFITKDEWLNEKNKYTLILDILSEIGNDGFPIIRVVVHQMPTHSDDFLTFRSQEDAERFLSYDENKELVCHYFMYDLEKNVND